jgi:hypothetical protein
MKRLSVLAAILGIGCVACVDDEHTDESRSLLALTLVVTDELARFEPLEIELKSEAEFSPDRESLDADVSFSVPEGGSFDDLVLSLASDESAIAVDATGEFETAEPLLQRVGVLVLTVRADQCWVLVRLGKAADGSARVTIGDYCP